MMPRHGPGRCVVNHLETCHTTLQENYCAENFYSAKGCGIHIHRDTRGVQPWRSQKLTSIKCKPACWRWNCLFALLNKVSTEKFINNLFSSSVDHGKPKHCTGQYLWSIVDLLSDFSLLESEENSFASTLCLTYKSFQINQNETKRKVYRRPPFWAVQSLHHLVSRHTEKHRLSQQPWYAPSLTSIKMM